MKQPYTVLDSLHYDREYKVGETAMLDEKTAAELMRLGVVEKAVPPKKSDPPPVDWDAKTVAELEKHLEKKGVEIPKDAKKAELVALCEANP